MMCLVSRDRRARHDWCTGEYQSAGICGAVDSKTRAAGCDRHPIQHALSSTAALASLDFSPSILRRIFAHPGIEPAWGHRATMPVIAHGSQPVRVLLIDDHAVVRTGLRM